MKNVQCNIPTGDILDVRQFSVGAEMNRPYEIEVLALSSSQTIDFDKVIGQEASFTVSRGAIDPSEPATGSSDDGGDNTLPEDPSKLSVWHGICAEMRQVRAESTGLATYRLIIVPDLWFLGHRTNNRIFQYLSEIEIVIKLLSEWGITPEVRVDLKQHKKRKYKVQYEETDLDFIHRLLEECGVAYFFSTDDTGFEASNRGQMVLTEFPQNAKRRNPSLAFHDEPARATETSYATNVELVRRVAPGKYTLRDHDYRKPPAYQLLSSSTDGIDAEKKLEIFDYVEGAFLYCNESGDGSTPTADKKGKTRTDESEGKALVAKRLHALRASSWVTSFETHSFDVGVGSVLGITGHPRTDLESDGLLVTSIQLAGAANSEWSMVVESVNAKHEYRPPLRTPRPMVSGVESATVVSNGDEIHTDEFGRVKVHFHWDRQSKMNDDSTCWIHVSQSWGGAGFGGTQLPRAGQEVMVEFLGGDPDRPVISGRLYTALQTTPYSLPANKTQSGTKTASTGGGGGYHELMFEDKGGQEFIRMRSQRDLHVQVNRHSNTNIDARETHNVGKTRVTNVHKSDTTTIKTDQTINVGGSFSHTIQHCGSIKSDKEGLALTAKTFLAFTSDTGEWNTSKGIVLTAGDGCPAPSSITIHPNGIIIRAPIVLINPTDAQATAMLTSGKSPADLAADEAAEKKAKADKARADADAAYNEAHKDDPVFTPIN